MDQNQLSKFFPTDRSVDVDTEIAIADLYKAAREFAFTINSLLPESAQKVEMLMRVFHTVRDAEMSLKLDGPSRMTPMIVTSTRQ